MSEEMRRGRVQAMTLMATAVIAALVVSTGIAIFSSYCRAAAEKKVAVKPSELPPAIRKAIETAFPGGEIIAIEKEVEGEDPGQYDVELRSGAKEYEIEVSPDGVVIEAKEKATGAAPAASGAEKAWTTSFRHETCSCAPTGKNRFFILEPGHQLVLEGKGEKVVITVLNETKKVAGVETRVVEERETKNGSLVEVSRNFFAICKEHGDVFYFGEEVDDYKDGAIVGHGGAWRADEKDSRPGIMMPGTVLLGARFYQEISPKAMDRAEVLRDDVTMTTPAGTFTQCVLMEETSPLEPGAKCFKTYAPGIGLIQDEALRLTSYGAAKDEGASHKK